MPSLIAWGYTYFSLSMAENGGNLKFQSIWWAGKSDRARYPILRHGHILVEPFEAFKIKKGSTSQMFPAHRVWNRYPYMSKIWNRHVDEHVQFKNGECSIAMLDYQKGTCAYLVHFSNYRYLTSHLGVFRFCSMCFAQCIWGVQPTIVGRDFPNQNQNRNSLKHDWEWGAAI